MTLHEIFSRNFRLTAVDGKGRKINALNAGIEKYMYHARGVKVKYAENMTATLGKKSSEILDLIIFLSAFCGSPEKAGMARK